MTTAREGRPARAATSASPEREPVLVASAAAERSRARPPSRRADDAPARKNKTFPSKPAPTRRRRRPTHLERAPHFVASLRYAMRSARSCGFFSPANTIFVPGMYFFGFKR
eukprot:29281-Pelagococcus_subviridis.AAC.7